MHVLTYVCACNACMYACMHACMHACMYVCMSMCTYIYIHTHVRVMSDIVLYYIMLNYTIFY